MRYTLARAAELAEASYQGKSHPEIGKQWKDSLKFNDVEAHLLTDNTVLIVGSNSWKDYIKYNLRVQRFGKARLSLSNVKVRAAWHQGFLAYTKAVQDWLMDKNTMPSFIIGHSLGAAATQILSAGWDVPGIAFAAPRTCRTKDAKSVAPKCLCVNRKDDAVTKVPGRYKHLGHVRWGVPEKPNKGMDHPMPNYRTIITKMVKDGDLPRVWP